MIAALLRSVRPVYREAAIFYYRWALHDLQRTNPHHEDMAKVVTRLRDLRAERETASPLWRWM